MTETHPTPENIMKVGRGFWASKVLMVAVKFGLFTYLAEKGAQSGISIKKHLHLDCTDHHVYDFLDALVNLGFLQREGFLDSAVYQNSPDSAAFLDKKKVEYMGGILEMQNNRLYPAWAHLEEALQTGKPQNESGKDGEPFEEMYKSPEKLAEFVHAMSGVQKGNFALFARKFDFSNYKSLTDAGGSGAWLSVMVAMHQPHMHCTSMDLAQVEFIAKSTIAQFGVEDRVKTANADFFADPIPKADVVVMGNILHDWNLEKKKILIKKAYEALPEGGAFVAIESIIDNERKDNIFGFLMSLNMLVETDGGFNFTMSEFEEWAREVGFKKTELMPLAGPSSAAIAYK